jgi:uncharacterized protein YndB with AHSA1/START domain
MAEAHPDTTALEITRRWDAPPERVWQAWTEPRALSRWFGPGEPDSVFQADVDLRPGGRYTIAFRTPDGEVHRVSGVYEEVDAPRKLSFSWAWQSTPERVSFVTVQLDADGAGTLMRFRHDRFFDRTARDNHERGWRATIDKLEAALAS